MRKSVGVVALAAGAIILGGYTAKAADIGVVPTKLIVIDKLAAASKAKAVYVAKDAGATKGGGTDATDISVTFTVAYDGETGEWTTGGADFLVNKTTVAKFVNKDAPSGPTVIKVAAIKPAKLLKMVAKERGDGDVLDILGQGAPSGSVFSAYQVVNGADTNTHCSEFNSCSYKLIAGDTGAKLVCKGGLADGACQATVPQNIWTFTTGTPAGLCGETKAGGAGGAHLKDLGCGGLNLGTGASNLAEGPTPEGAPSRFAATCGGGICTLGGTTGGDPNSCTNTGCPFGPPLPIENGGTSTCVLNTFGSPGSGTVTLATGTFNGAIPLSSETHLTGNDLEPCPLCKDQGGGNFQCDPGWVNFFSAVPSPNAGNPCTPINFLAADSLGNPYPANTVGNSYDCLPPADAAVQSPFNPFDVPLVPADSATLSADSTAGTAGDFCGANGIIATCTVPLTCEDGSPCPNGLDSDCPAPIPPATHNFCRQCASPWGNAETGQRSPGCFGNGTCDYIRADGVPAGAIGGGNFSSHSITLASIFCVPATGNGLVDGTAALPGPGVVTLPGTGSFDIDPTL